MHIEENALTKEIFITVITPELVLGLQSGLFYSWDQVPWAASLCVVVFDDVIGMPAWENINRVLSGLGQSSCCERRLHPRLQGCLGQSGSTAVLSRGESSVGGRSRICALAAKQGRSQTSRCICRQLNGRKWIVVKCHPVSRLLSGLLGQQTGVQYYNMWDSSKKGPSRYLKVVNSLKCHVLCF